jgi:hypothetical protein
MGESIDTIFRLTSRHQAGADLVQQEGQEDGADRIATGAKVETSV